MKPYNRSIGILGEELALNYLRKNKFTVLSRNFRSRMGEIDIIAKKTKSIHFIEVKTRVGLSKGKPYEAVNKYKLQRIKNTAYYYLLKNKKNGYKLSIDVVSIVLDNEKKPVEFEHFTGVIL